MSAGQFGLALAGGYAINAHGIGDRPSADVDLFMDWHQRADFPQAVDLVLTALSDHGYAVTVVARNETYARLQIDERGRADEPLKMELSADWRTHPPVSLAIGPVLHRDDAVANKMCALFGRAEARDFVDIDAVLQSGQYTRPELLDLAAGADAGFDRTLFAAALGALDQITDAAFDGYNKTADQVTAMRRRYADWRQELIMPA